MDLDNIELEDFLTGTKAINLKIPARSSAKAVVCRNGKELFWYTKYENLPHLIKEAIEGPATPPVAPAGSTKAAPPKPAAPAVTSIDGRELTQAEMTLLKIRERFDFFKTMSEKEVLAVTSHVLLMRLDKDEIVFEQEDPGQEVFFIVKGTVDITISAEQGGGTVQKYADRTLIASLRPETIFGEMAPITGEKRSARAVSASSGTTLLSFRIAQEIPEGSERAFAILFKNFTRVLAKKLANTNKMLLNKN